jgi:hypothetical protein
VLGEALAGQMRYHEAAPHAKIAVQLLVKSAVTAYAHELSAAATQLAEKVEGKLRITP